MTAANFKLCKNSPEIVIELIVDKLRAYFDSSMKEGVGPLFDKMVVPNYFNVASPSGASVQLEMERLYRDDPAKFNMHGPFAPLLISCAYCGEARRALDANDREAAWSLISDAQYWFGVTMAGSGIPEAHKKTVEAAFKASKKSVAASGGDARADRYGDLKAEAFRLVREQCPDERWSSFREASRAVAEAVCHRSLKVAGPRLAEDSAAATIARWLKKIPDRAQYFQGKKRTASPRVKR